MTQKRLEAAQRGETIYQGKPCQTCGSTDRYVANNRCVPCAKKSAKEHNEKFQRILKAAKEKQASQHEDG